MSKNKPIIKDRIKLDKVITFHKEQQRLQDRKEFKGVGCLIVKYVRADCGV